MTYRLLAPVARDISNIEAWVASEFGEAAAATARRKLLESFELLADFPYLGRLRPEVTSLPFRFYAVAPNWVVYRPGKPVLVHRVFDARVNVGKVKL